MASKDPTIRAIEKAAKAAFPNKSQQAQRFAYRNQLRAQYGLAAEKRQRGGAAGVYDRNKQIANPVLALAAGFAVPFVAAPLAGLSKFLPASTSTLGSNLMRYAGNGPVLFGNSRGNEAGLLGAAGTVIKEVGRSAATGIVTGLVNRFLPPGPPSLPGGQGGGTPIPRPREGIIGRTISRLLPGGMTGNEWTPVNDMTDRVGRPLAVYPAERTSVVGPQGYVMVTMNGERIAMLRSFAIRAGLYKAPPKPPLSGYDMRAIQRAHTATKRVKKLASKVGFIVAKRGTAQLKRLGAGKRR